MVQYWLSPHVLFFFFLRYLFIWLHWVLVEALWVFNVCCSMWTLSWGMWDLVSWPGMEPGHPALGMWSPSHWNMREGPPTMFFGKLLNPSEPLECHQRNENNNRTFLWLCVCVCIQQLTAALSPLPGMHSFNKYLFIKITGLPRWHNGKEPTFQCRRCKRRRFGP